LARIPAQSGLAGINNVLPESHNERNPTLLAKPAIGTVRSSAILGPTEKIMNFNIIPSQDLDLFSV